MVYLKLRWHTLSVALDPLRHIWGWASLWGCTWALAFVWTLNILLCWPPCSHVSGQRGYHPCQGCKENMGNALQNRNLALLEYNHVWPIIAQQIHSKTKRITAGLILITLPNLSLPSPVVHTFLTVQTCLKHWEQINNFRHKGVTNYYKSVRCGNLHPSAAKLLVIKCILAYQDRKLSAAQFVHFYIM